MKVACRRVSSLERSDRRSESKSNTRRDGIDRNEPREYGIRERRRKRKRQNGPTAVGNSSGREPAERASTSSVGE
ncbi:hypothetical protein CP556_08355 [Natrinema sp. CBA1119]|nr:hypothetical protein CP556_08355 [Natrinema sp. CBA1119]